MQWAETRRQLCLISRRARMQESGKAAQIVKLIVTISDRLNMLRIVTFGRSQGHELSCFQSDDRRGW